MQATALHPLYLKRGASILRASLHGGGEPQKGKVTCGGSPHLSFKLNQIKMRDYMARGATPPKQVA